MSTTESLRTEADARRALASCQTGRHPDSVAQYLAAHAYAERGVRPETGPSALQGPSGVRNVGVEGEVMTMAVDDTLQPDRERAVRRLKKKRDFYAHLFVYAVVNGFLVAIWAVTNVQAFFWPIFPILGWGVAVVLNAWDVYRTDTFSEAEIRREIEHLQRHR
jgi:hypothetical protein